MLLPDTNNKSNRNKAGQYEHPNLSTSISEETIYSVESSDSENDDILTNDKVIELHKKPKEKAVSIETTSCGIAQSHTMPADHNANLETAKVIKYEKIITGSSNNNDFFSINTTKTQSVHKKKNKYKEIMKQKNKNSSYSMGALKEELSEVEIKLKECEHQKDVLKQENEALRAAIQAFHNKYGDIVGSGFELNELFAKTTLLNASLLNTTHRSHSMDKGYTVSRCNTPSHTPSHTEDLQYLLSPKEHHGILSPSITPPPTAPTICESHEEIILTIDDKDDDNKLPPCTPKMHINITPSNSCCTSEVHTPTAINWNNSGSKENHHIFFTSNGDNKLNSYKSPTHASHGSNDSTLPTTNPLLTCSVTTDSNATNETTKIHHDHDPALTLTLTKMPSALSSPRSSVISIKSNVFSPQKRRSASVPSFDTKKLSASLSLFNGDVDIDEKCKGDIDDCPGIKRIISALKWYAISGDDHEMLYKKMKTDNYGKQIVDDYNHIMQYHLNDNGKTDREIRMEYDLIVNMVHKAVGDCKFIQCAGYRRYLRCKNTDIGGGGQHKAQNKEQHELQMYVNTMDGIHCCFMHLAKSLRN